MRVVYKGPLSQYSGYGNDGIGLCLALAKAGHDVRILPTAIQAPLPTDVAWMMTRSIEPPFDMVINHIDPYQMEITSGERRNADFILGWTMWEFTELFRRPPTLGTKPFAERLRGMDMLLGYDEVTKMAWMPVCQRVGISMSILQGGADFTNWKYAEDRQWDGPFRFIMVGQLHQRKDPFVAIQAFKELKEEQGADFEDAELHLKTNVPGLHSAMQEWCPKLKIHYASWPIETLQAFYANSHVLLAPSRGEGKNMPALEFMATGGTVIVTNHGGHRQWLRSDIGYPLDFKLAPHTPRQKSMLEARASKDHLKKLMLHVYQNRGEARRKGEVAATTVPNMCSWESVVERLFLKIKEHSERGADIHRRALSVRHAPPLHETEAGR